MSEQTRQAVLERMTGAWGRWDPKASEADEETLDAYVADECRRAVAAVGCLYVWANDPANGGDGDPLETTCSRLEGFTNSADWCAPCRAQAEIDKEAERAAKG